MSKVIDKKNKENGEVKEVSKEREAIENLRVQLKNHIEQAEHHKIMAKKAQGALEVLLQLHPEEENN